MDITDQQWALLEPLFEEKRRADGRGRPWRDARAVLNGVLWVLRTGAPWKICRPDIRPIKPAIAGSSSGSGAASFGRCSKRSRGISATAGAWI